MAQIRELADKVGRSYDIDPRKLKVKPGLNVRDLETPESIAELDKLMNEIIEAGGVRIPVEIFTEGDDIYVSHGHRRRAAVLKAISTRDFVCATVPCMLEPRGRNEIDRIYDQYTLNNTGLPLSVFEIGYNIRRLIVAGESIPQIAKRHAKTVGWVDGILKVLEAPPEAQAMVKAGEIAPTLMNEIIREQGVTEGTASLKRAVTKAKASGKKKATKRDVEAALPKAPSLEPSLPPFCGPEALEKSYVRVLESAIVLARDFLERVGFDFADPATCKEAERIVAELNRALGKPMQMAAE